MSPYDMSEIAFDLGDKTFGNMAPVGIIARKTLIEAETFAKSNGFKPLYFTTQYSDKEFDREPRFFLTEEKVVEKPMWFVPWAAAAAIGLTIGYFGYSYFTGQRADQPVAVAAVVEQPATAVTPVVEPEPAVQVTAPEPEEPVSTAQLGLQDIAPKLPLVNTTLRAPETTQYPTLQLAAQTSTTQLDNPLVTRLQPAQSDTPKVSASSKELKTSDLQIAEARRDLPDVSVNEEIVSIIQSDMSLLGLAPAENTAPIQLASLTAPNQLFDAALINQLPRSDSGAETLSDAAKQTADRPPLPEAIANAEPGTLIPTPEGTLGPDYIKIYSGRPANAPRERAPEIDPLAGFKPRLRPDTLVVPEQNLEVAAAVEPEAEAPSILALADPALRPFRAQLRPETLVVLNTEPAVVEEPSILALADPTLRPLRARLRPETLVVLAEPEPAAEPEEPTILALADPTLRPFRALLRPEGLTPVAQVALAEETPTQTPDLDSIVNAAIESAETPQTDEVTNAILQNTIAQAIEQDADALIQSDPALRPFRARVRPSGLLSETQLAALTTDGAAPQSDAAPTLLALADPSLSGLRARTRPGNLRILTPAETQGLLALADPALAGKRARSRPRQLRIIQEPEPAPEETAVEAPEEPEIRGTIHAVAVSPKPQIRPRKLARVVKRVRSDATRSTAAASNNVSRDTSGIAASGGSTRATAKLPRSAVGTVKSAPPTSSVVARAATEKSRFKKSRMSLVGIFGAPSKRRALVRLPTGRYVKVQKGDKISGWNVSAIGESSLRIKKGSRDQVLRMP